MLCVHIGPGRLGLGLVVDTLLDLGLEVCLVGAEDRTPPDLAQYRIAFVDPRAGLRIREVRWVANPGSIADLDAEVRDRLARDEPVLVTAALGEAALAREALMRELLDVRPAGAETVLLACENVVDDVYQRVADDYPDVDLCPVVVDRVCTWNEPARDDEGRRCFIVHRVTQWVIGRPPSKRPSAIIDCLDSCKHVHVVDGSVDAYTRRKVWINGVQLVLALCARRDGHDLLGLGGERGAAFQAEAGPLVSIIVDALSVLHPELGTDKAFVLDRVRAFCETPGSTRRMLEGRLVRCDLRPLLERMDSRIGDTARAVHAAGLGCEAFDTVVELLLRTLEVRFVYDESGKPPTDEIDEEVVSVFKRLVFGWMEPERAEKAAARLERLLALHRREPPAARGH